MPNGASFAAVLNVLKIPFRVFSSNSLIAEAQKVPADLAARLDHLRKVSETEDSAGRPVPVIARYVAVFAGGFIVAEMFGVVLMNGWFPSIFDRLFTFGCGLTLTAFVLVYLWLAPIVTGKGGRSG
jgi:hypothetical protein